MDLAKLTVSLRPRTTWEGIDLGFALARQWFLPLWLLWLTGAVPVFLLLNLLLPIESWVAGILSWWLKPLYEPPLTFWLGRVVFAECPGRQEMQRRWLQIVWPQLLANLSWRRFSASRSFVMPVAVLEGLRGKDRASRIQVLARQQHAAGWLTISGIHFEVILELSFLMLLVMLLPEELQWLEMQSFLFEPKGWEQWLQQLTGLVAMSAIAPFYVAAGFGLYLTRRSQLEAWDVELGLRHMSERFQSKRLIAGLLIGLLSGLMIFSLPTQPVAAMELSREEAKTLIQSVMQADDFGQRETHSYWKYIGEKDDEEIEDEDLPWWLEWLIDIVEGFLQGFAVLGEWLMWLAAGGVLAYLIVWFVQNHGLLGRGSEGQREAQQLPVSIAGLDIRPETLPADIVAEARRYLSQGDPRAALSLLYRGALSALVHRHLLEIPRSATENECLLLVQKLQQPSDYAYLKRLTQVWQELAYGHRAPDINEAEQLCQSWGGVYGE